MFYHRSKVSPSRVHCLNYSEPKVISFGAKPHRHIEPPDVKLEKVIVQVSSPTVAVAAGAHVDKPAKRSEAAKTPRIDSDVLYSDVLYCSAVLCCFKVEIAGEETKAHIYRG